MNEDDAEVLRLLGESADRLFRRHADRASDGTWTSGGWPDELWRAAEVADLPLVGVPVARGGAGGTIVHAAEVVRIAAHHAASVPLAETGLLAGWLLTEADQAVPRGPLTAASVSLQPGETPICPGVPYARNADAIVLVIVEGASTLVALVGPEDCEITPGTNLAGEPRDQVVVRRGLLDRAWVVRDDLSDLLMLRGALARSVQITGAVEAVLERTVEYTQRRIQFGRPLAQLSPVRERLALLAEECAVAGAAVEAAVAAWDCGRTGQLEFATAAAKVQAGEAAGHAARIAHQLHGAVGMTAEADLHRLTTRLWSWRDEYGDERYWALRLGRMVSALGGDGAWEMLTCEDPENRSIRV